MSQAYFRFYGQLNEFLPKGKRGITYQYRLNGPVAVKHPIEALGVPHTEVELLLANGRSVDFSYLVQPGDRLAVYPGFSNLDVSSLQRLRPPLPYPPRFIADGHLGQLVTYLRLLGFDTLYRSDYSDKELAQIAHQHDRVLLTRDRRLLMRKLVVYGCCLRSRTPDQQLATVLKRYRLHPFIKPWRRCLRCNGRLQPVLKEDVWDRLEPKTKLYYHDFHLCLNCQQIYWKGSHYEPLRKFVDSIVRTP